MNIKVIVTGASGMVGEGVLNECLQRNEVQEVLVVGRRACGMTDQKLKEILIPDFFDLSGVRDQLTGYDACFFCLGVSSVGMKEPEFEKLTHSLTMNFATTVAAQNPDMVFCYISGKGTDSSEKGRQMWARVKGKTENDLARLPFKKEYNFRPGIIKPTKGLRNTLKVYSYLGWLIPIIKLFGSNLVSSLKEIGNAMINVVILGYEKQTLEVSDIISLAKRNSP